MRIVVGLQAGCQCTGRDILQCFLPLRHGEDHLSNKAFHLTQSFLHFLQLFNVSQSFLHFLQLIIPCNIVCHFPWRKERMEWNQWLECVSLYRSYIVYKGVEGEGRGCERQRIEM